MGSNITVANDYRNTEYTNHDFNLGSKKIDFMDEFRIRHPRAENIYNYIRNRQNGFNRVFRFIYYEKCAYCGINTQVIDSSKFEVDHFIPESVLRLELGYTYAHINGIDNLVNSCQMCNRGKTNFLPSKENIDLLHPDNNKLPLIFERLDDYSIRIREEYKENTDINKFYLDLNFENQLRRLDFLLMEMKDFCDIYPTESIVKDMQTLILKIESKRRRNY
ncbi:HNH endonuclease [Lysinibacillus xylanilyticus]|uniref:HNH endonuclease n=1 Tax=Lysinibacillus xylanilyticus TaxID=582475 RepID=UPI003D08A335